MSDLAALTRNAVKVLPEGELERKLALGRPLRVKLGIDPTARDIHIGQAIPLQRMRAFQDQGHRQSHQLHTRTSNEDFLKACIQSSRFETVHTFVEPSQLETRPLR